LGPGEHGYIEIADPNLSTLQIILRILDARVAENALSLDGRLDQLPEKAKKMLQMVSVIPEL
jgi:hypothetical protein